MKRWIWTLLITLCLGLAIGCGSKGGSGSTKAPTPTTQDPDVVPPTCSSTVTEDCTPPKNFYKSAWGYLDFTNFNEFRSLRKKYIGCDGYTGLNLYFFTIPGINIGSYSCDSWNNVSFNFTIENDKIWIYMYIHCTDWSCGDYYATIPVVSGEPLYKIDGNTGYGVNGTVHNDLYSFRIENQDLEGTIKVKVSVKKYNLQNPSGNITVPIGTVTAEDVH